MRSLFIKGCERVGNIHGDTRNRRTLKKKSREGGNKTPVAQTLRLIINKWYLLIMKILCKGKNTVNKRKEMENDLHQPHI